MLDDQVRLRISWSAREVEVEGPDAVVRGWYERLGATIDAMRDGVADPANRVSKNRVANSSGSQSGSPVSAGDDDEPFGEFVHQFRNELTDVDRILIAGAHAQAASDDNTFRTADASERWLEQGHRVGNPAECVRRNQANRRIIRVRRGVFRISEPGRSQLEALRDEQS